MNRPWTYYILGLLPASAKFGLWWRQKKGFNFIYCSFCWLARSRLCLNQNFIVCVDPIQDHLAKFSLPSLFCQSPGIFEVWTTSMFAPNICFKFFPGPLRVTFHLSAFHHSHAPARGHRGHSGFLHFPPLGVSVLHHFSLISLGSTHTLWTGLFVHSSSTNPFERVANDFWQRSHW